MVKLSERENVNELIEEHRAQDPEFRQQWDRTAFARAVAHRIISYRAEHGLTQTQLARKVGTTQSVIGRLELGEQPPSLATLAKLTATPASSFISTSPAGMSSCRLEPAAGRRVLTCGPARSLGRVSGAAAVVEIRQAEGDASVGRAIDERHASGPAGTDDWLDRPPAVATLSEVRRGGGPSVRAARGRSRRAGRRGRPGCSARPGGRR